MQINVTNSLEAFLQMSSQKPRSSEQVQRTLTDRTLTEWEQNSTEQIGNGYETDREQELEHMRNSNRVHFVKRSLLGFF